MSFQPAHRIILATGFVLVGMLTLSACGQKGPLYLPTDPAAAQRATLPQTVFGGGSAPAKPAPAASAAPTPRPPPMPLEPSLPNSALPED